jgi:hypothetical protein
MPYLTKFNAQRIVTSNDFKATGNLDGEVYKIPIYFFADFEKNKLIGMQRLLEDPAKFISEYYIAIKTEDRLQYIYEGKKPAYHAKVDCARLNSDYQNFKIPDEIKEAGKEKVLEFRTWFEEHKHLLEKPDVFIERLRLKFGVKLDITEINKDNSGVEDKENLDLKALEGKIDEIIKEAGAYFKNANVSKQVILRRFQKLTFLAYRKDEIYNNNTGYTDEVLKGFLKKYDQHFKRPVMNLLLEYYRVKLNPELKFEEGLLDQLGFNRCMHCHK